MILFDTIRQRTPSHSQWVTSVLLHLSCGNLALPTLRDLLEYISYTDKTTVIPLDATLNFLLLWYIFSGFSLPFYQ